MTSGTEAQGGDRELLDRFVRGDEDAVRQIYRRYHGPLHAAVVHLVHDHDQAAEVVQEAFLSAWRGAGRFDPSRPLAPWLFSIARRCAIDSLRRAGRRPVCVDGGPEGAVDGPAIDRLWVTWEVRAAVDRLPPRERQVVALSHYHGLTLAQIGLRLGIPLGTVKSRSFRAHRRLAGWLGHLVEDPTPARAPGRRPLRG